MLLFALTVAFGLFVLWAGILAYRWLFLSQRHHTYGTLVVPREKEQVGGWKSPALFRHLGALWSRLTQPIGKSSSAANKHISPLDGPTQAA
jgi:hypothetical protein